jgi:hypothetical protein
MSAETSPHWGSWMCPEFQPHHELELERGKRALESGSPADVLAMAMKLWRLTIHQDRIIRAATRHIAELEAREALAGYCPGSGPV